MATDKKQFSTTKKTYENAASDYADKNSDSHIMAKQRNEFKELLPKGRILDVGCGTGRDARWFSENGYDVTGVDYSANMLKIARKEAPKADFLKKDMRNLGFDRDSFDGIWCVGSLHHVDNPDAKFILLELNLFLRRGGIIYVSVKEGEGQTMEKDYLGGERLFCRYTLKELGTMMKAAGFRLVRGYVSEGARNQNWVNIFAKS